jgi:hypothetical protein
MKLKGRRSLLTSSNFPYAGGEEVELEQSEVWALGKLAVWRSTVSQILARLEGDELVHLRLESQVPEAQVWLKEMLKYVRPREPSKVPGWTITWKELPAGDSR